MKEANEIVGQVPEILEIIMSHFNTINLSRAATVSRLWNEVATCELQKRGPQIIEMPVPNVYDHMETKPHVTLFFINSSSWRISDLQECQNSFPNHTVIVPTKNVMMDEKKIVYNHFQSKCGIVCLLLPQYRDLKIRAYDENLLTSIGSACSKSHADELIQTFLDKFLPEDSQSKATFILFGPGHYPFNRYLELLQERMLERQQEYSIWGADVFTGPLTKMELSDHEGLFAMSITGSSLVSSSIVISCMKPKETVDRKLLKFRDQMHLKRYSIGLLSGPDHNWETLPWICRYRPRPTRRYTREKLTETLKSIFPDVPFIGIHDNFRCYGLMSKNKDFKQKLDHRNSFSLMILTFD